MKRIKVEELQRTFQEKLGEDVFLKGWVHKIRHQSKFSFLVLREVTGTVQVFIEGSKLLEQVQLIQSESVVEVVGTVKEEMQAPGGFEIVAKEIKVLSEPSSDLPFAVYEKGEEPELSLRLDYRWIDLRKPEKTLIFKIWTSMEKYMRKFWSEEGFIEIHSPKLLGIPSEGGAEAFEIEYFGQKAYLAQSPQFYKQMAMAAGFEKVFEVGPIFRANKSFTSRHDTEFTGLDMEISFIESVEDVMEFEEQWIVYWLTKLKEEWGIVIDEVYGRKLVIPERPFPRFTVREVKEILGTTGFDISTEEEKAIGEYVHKKFDHEFVFITKWPWESRPFYHMKVEGKELSDSFDLLWQGMEITTGAQREHRYEILLEQAKEKGITIKSFQSYLDFFKYGCPPHGGMGLSPTRLLMKILGITNVREVTFVPRDPKRLIP